MPEPKDDNDGGDKGGGGDGGNIRLSDSSNPNSKWWDRTTSNLDIHDIGAEGEVMTFSAKI